MKADSKSYEAKFLIYASVLDILATRTVESVISDSKDCTITFNELKSKMRETDVVARIMKPYSERQINIWISELSWMGLITRVSESTTNSTLQLTKEGVEAYRNQTFHSVAANLLESRESRRLSIIAIWVAVAAIFISLIPNIVAAYRQLICIIG